MLRRTALALLVAVGGLTGAATVSTPAGAQVYFGYDDGYREYRRERRWRDDDYDYDRPRYRSYPRAYYSERSYRGRDCWVEKRKYWNGYKYARGPVRVCN